MAMSATDSGYRYVERFSLPVLVARAVVVDFDSALRIKRVRSETQIGPRTARTDIRYVDGRAEGTATAVSAGSGAPVPIDTFLPPDAFDGMALFPVILSRPWRVGLVDTLTIWDSDERSVTRQLLRVTGTERVQTPAGDFDAFRAELTTTQLPVTLWVSIARPHRLLRTASVSGETVLVRR